MAANRLVQFHRQDDGHSDEDHPWPEFQRDRLNAEDELQEGNVQRHDVQRERWVLERALPTWKV